MRYDYLFKLLLSGLCVVLLSAEISDAKKKKKHEEPAKVNCNEFLGKGYCTDYIAERTGKRQRGDAKNWRGDISKDEVRPGDVAIFDFGRWGHVAYVERVYYNPNTKRPESLYITEKNWGAPLDSCAKGPNFGIPTNRTISVNKVTRFWRP